MANRSLLLRPRWQWLVCASLLGASAVWAQTPPASPPSPASAKTEPTRARIDAIVDQLIAADRTARGLGIAGCPDCASAVKTTGLNLDMLAATDEPETNAWLQQATQFARSYIANQGADFHPPKTAKPLNCPDAAETLRKLGGLLHFSEQEENFQQTMLKGYGEGPDRYVGYIRDLKIWPVQATCVQGQLDGPLDFWMFGREVRSYEGKVLVDSKLVHYRTQMRAGQPVGAHTAIVRSALDAIEGSGAAMKVLQRAGDMDTLSYAQVRLQARGGDGKSTALVFSVTPPTAEKPQDKATVSFTVPLEDGDTFRTMYRGTQKSETSQMRNNKRHGLSQFWPFSEPLGPGLPDYTFPGSETCYRDGLPVNLKPCTTDDATTPSSRPSHYTLQDFGRVVLLVPFDKRVGFDRGDEQVA